MINLERKFSLLPGAPISSWCGLWIVYTCSIVELRCKNITSDVYPPNTFVFVLPPSSGFQPSFLVPAVKLLVSFFWGGGEFLYFASSFPYICSVRSAVYTQRLGVPWFSHWHVFAWVISSLWVSGTNNKKNGIVVDFSWSVYTAVSTRVRHNRKEKRVNGKPK